LGSAACPPSSVASCQVDARVELAHPAARAPVSSSGLPLAPFPLSFVTHDAPFASHPADVDVTNADHKRRFMEAIGGGVGEDGLTIIPPSDDGTHGAMSAAEAQRSYEAMALWDDFMASSVAGYVSAGPKRGAGLNGASSTGTERMVVLVGASHVRGRVGLPDRYARRAHVPTFTLVPLSVPWPPVGGSSSRPPRGADPLPTSEADWVVYTRPRDSRVA
jgi:hypothetical protein